MRDIACPSAQKLAVLCELSLTRLAAIPEEPPTPLWELILEQFKDQLVIILLGSAAVSFVLALFEDEGGWSAFVDPAVVCLHTIPSAYNYRHRLTLV